MNISKVTVLPHNIGIKKLVIKQPNQDILDSVFRTSVSLDKEKIPNKIIKKLMKKNNIPEYINQNCYTAKTNKCSEDARVIGGENISIFA